MLGLYERWVLFQGLRIETEPEHAPEFELNDILPQLVASVQDDEAIKLIRNDTASIRIADINVTESHVELLFQYADKNTTDPVFMNMNTNQLRPIHRLDGEGIAVSGHAVIKRAKADDGSYQLLMEQVTGLGRSNVEPFIRSLFKSLSTDLTFEDETDNNRRKKYRPVAKLESDVSSKFKDDLDEGTVEGIELISRTQAGGVDFDEPNFFREQARVIKLGVVTKKDDSLLDRITELARRARRNGYEKIKIRYKKPEGKQRTIGMGTTVTDVAEQIITKNELVTSDDILEQCVDSINRDFMAKMVARLS
ncbi:hypothetical protein [Gynuella sp.]|uniref:hypothetical protein n=1 Tax=Gynuella sp. TaxID=2969146 RepID=UPI003D0E2738